MFLLRGCTRDKRLVSVFETKNLSKITMIIYFIGILCTWNWTWDPIPTQIYGNLSEVDEDESPRYISRKGISISCN